MTLDVLSKSLTIYTNRSGQLELTLPRDVIDSKDANKSETKVTVLVNETKVDASETRSETSSRTIVIDYCTGESPCNVARITIVGTNVVPEFGSLPAVIAALSIASLVIAFKSSQLSAFRKVQSD